jgi:hypothetical protein
MMIDYKCFRSSSYTILLHVTWSRFMMIAVLNRDWHISFTVRILQNKGFWKFCSFSSTEFVIQCCSSASAGCVSLTADFCKRHSKMFSSKIVILIADVPVIPFISQSVESWLSSGTYVCSEGLYFWLAGAHSVTIQQGVCQTIAEHYNLNKVTNLVELFGCTTRMSCK